jgi:rubrerythrin
MAKAVKRPERFEDFVKFAIGQERAAATLYAEYAAVATSRPTQLLLDEMAAMERSHETKLKVLLATGMASFPRPGEVRDLHVSDFMAAEELAPGSPLDKVYVFAMKAEQMANELYLKLAALEVDAPTRELLLSLAAEEEKHKRDLETQYERVFMRDN